MAFVSPFVFLTGSDLLASPLDANYSAARDYLNGGIVSGDIETNSIDAERLAESTTISGGQGRRLVTGNVYHYTALIDDTVERVYATCTVKTSDPTQQVLYLSLPGASRTITLESAGALLVECTGHVVVVDSDTTSPYRTMISPSPVLVDSRFYLRIDGEIVANTRSYHFTEDSGAPTSQSIANTTSDFSILAQARRPLYLFHVERSLSAGHHTIEVVVDARAEVLFLGAVSIQMECLPDCGYTSYTGADAFMR